MNVFTKTLKNSWTIQETEFAALASWLLLYPWKEGWPYFLVFTGLAVLICLRHVIRLRNISINSFTRTILVFNLIVIGVSFFSPWRWKSLLFCTDLLLLSILFAWWESPVKNPRTYYSLLAFIISITSAANLIAYFIHLHLRQVSLFFPNPILQGIASGVATIFSLSAILEKFRPFHVALLLINVSALLISGSKAAFLGAMIISASLIVSRKRGWLKYLLLFLLLFVLVPTPLRERVGPAALKKDPYTFDRIRIWKMSFRMLADHPWTGVGPALFGETARQYNFPQDKGYSRYGKVPESPHSDLLKLLVELGVAGLAALTILLVPLTRKLLSPPIGNPVKLATIFLVSQSLVFNYLFEPFFLFLFLFLLKSLLEENRTLYVSPGPCLRIAFGGTVLSILLLANLFPAWASHLSRKALSCTDPVKAFRLLQTAKRLDPTSHQIPYWQGVLTSTLFRAQGHLDAATDAIGYFEESRRKNPFHIPAYLRQAEIYQTMEEKGRTYAGMKTEMLAPLKRASLLDPYNPFLRFQQAMICLRFGDRTGARDWAQRALELEPDYVAALVFLHRHFAYLEEEVFAKRMASIREKTARSRFPPESYLGKLFRFPE